MQVCLESPVCQTRFWSIVRTAVVAAAGAIGECCGRAVVASARRQTLRLWADGGGNPKGRTTVVTPIARTTIARRSSISRPRLSWKIFVSIPRCSRERSQTRTTVCRSVWSLLSAGLGSAWLFGRRWWRRLIGLAILRAGGAASARRGNPKALGGRRRKP